MLSGMHFFRVVMLGGIVASLLLQWKQDAERRAALCKFQDLCVRLESGRKGPSASEVEAQVQEDLDWIYEVGVAVGFEKAKER